MSDTTLGERIAALHVLIVEDNEFQRAVLAASLKALGLQHVDQASDGQSALNLLAGHPSGYDLAICDLQMEGMDGIEFMRHAAHQRLGALIVLSAMGTDLLSSAAAIAAAHGLPLLGQLSKPVDMGQLKQLIGAHALAPAARSAPAGLQPRARQWRHAELVQALQQGQFVPHFQPKIDLNNGAVAGAEILARWNHPELGVLAPFEFIDQLEAEQLNDQLTETLLHQALACASAWPARHAPVGLAVNASALTLQNVDMPNRLLAIARRHGASPRQLTIELTETVLANDDDSLLETLTRLRMHGFGVSLDDFGAGFSSLHQLSRIPFTKLKIDRSLVTGAHLKPRLISILESIMALTRSLRIETVAEGIETTADLALIHQLGCSLGQGYLFARPLAARAWLDWYRDYQPAPLFSAAAGARDRRASASRRGAER